MATIHSDCGCVYQQGFPGGHLFECAAHVQERLDHLTQFSTQLETIAKTRGFVSADAMIDDRIRLMQKLGVKEFHD